MYFSCGLVIKSVFLSGSLPGQVSVLQFWGSDLQSGVQLLGVIPALSHLFCTVSTRATIFAS